MKIVRRGKRDIRNGRRRMKKYRVWGYETQGYHIDLEANNKQDAHDKAMDIDREDWQIGNDGVEYLL